MLYKMHGCIRCIMVIVRGMDKWRSIHLSLNFLLLFLSREKVNNLALRQKVNLHTHGIFQTSSAIIEY